MSTETTNSRKPKPSRPRPSTRHAPTNQGRTRQDQLLAQLSRKVGTDVPTLCKTFGWQPHTARAALSALRKAGHNVIRDPASNGKPSRYRVVRSPDGAGSRAAVEEAMANAG
jgi:hypothetical protein